MPTFVQILCEMKKQFIFYVSCLMGIILLSCNEKKQKPDYKISQNDTLKIELNYTAGTGYSWFLENKEEVKILDSTNVEFFANNNLIGGSGTEIWSFVATEKGTCTLSFVYKRPWENSIAEKKEFVILVK